MSVQEIKEHVHHLVHETEDETILEIVSRILSESSESGGPENLTDEQIAGIEKAREEARQGKGMLKRKLEQRWPQLR